jgi:ATP-dependent helicase/DNAse subunit B
MARLIEDITDPMELLSLSRMSYSRYNSFESCEAKYFYTYVLREPSTFGEAAVVGNIIHTALENTLEDGVNVADVADDLMKDYKNQIEIFDPESQISEDLLEVGEVMLGQFIDRHAHEAFPIHAKEKAFAIVAGTTLIAGYIDRVDMPEDSDILYITDYKSGKFEVTKKWIHKDLQLGIYALAMKTIFPDKQIHAELYYLRSGKQKGHLFTDEDLAEVEQRVIDLSTEVRNKKVFNYTNNRRICMHLCDHGKTGACPRGVSVVKAMPPKKR